MATNEGFVPSSLTCQTTFWLQIELSFEIANHPEAAGVRAQRVRVLR